MRNYLSVKESFYIITHTIYTVAIRMLLPSEIEAKSLIPAIRAILARKLINEYDLKEEVVAKVAWYYSGKCKQLHKRHQG